jgi:hypothetical protein
MGRSFLSVRQGVNHLADRWTRASRALKKEDQPHGMKLVELAKKHSSEAFVACDDPLEAAVFSVLVEMLRRQDQIESQLKKDGETGTQQNKRGSGDFLFREV